MQNKHDKAVSIPFSRSINNRSPASILAIIIVYVILIVYFIVIAYPLFWMIMSSFKTTNEIFSNVWGLPQRWSVDNFVEAWNTGISRYFFNSVFVTVVTCIMTVFMSALGAFALSRFKFTGKSLLLIFCLGGLMVSPQVSLIPLYKLTQSIGIFNTHWALILPYVSYRISFTILLIRAFFLSIPKEYEEAAFVDGYGIIRVFILIFLPMSVPVLCTAAILAAYFSWNEFLFAIVFINSDSLRTVPAGLMQLQGVLQTNWGVLLAGLTISAVPIILLFSFMQKYFVRGLTSGGIKG